MEPELVPLLRPHQDLPPPGGVHPATADAGIVQSLRHQLSVVVEVGELVFHWYSKHDADPPVPGHGHSKDACNETNVKRVIQSFVNVIPDVISSGVTDTNILLVSLNTNRS